MVTIKFNTEISKSHTIWTDFEESYYNGKLTCEEALDNIRRLSSKSPAHTRNALATKYLPLMIEDALKNGEFSPEQAVNAYNLSAYLLTPRPAAFSSQRFHYSLQAAKSIMRIYEEFKKTNDGYGKGQANTIEASTIANALRALGNKLEARERAQFHEDVTLPFIDVELMQKPTSPRMLQYQRDLTKRDSDPARDIELMHPYGL